MAAPCRGRLAQIVEKRREPHPQRRTGVRSRLDDHERVLVERQVVIAALLVEPDRRRPSPAAGGRARPSRGRAAAPWRAARPSAASRARPFHRRRARRRSARPRRARSAAPTRASGGACPRPDRHRAERRSGARARSAADRRESSSGSSYEGSSGSRSARPPSGSSTSPVSSRRAIALIVKSRRSMSCSSEIPASATISKSCRPGPVERSTRGGAKSIPPGCRARAALSRGSSRTPTRWSATTRSSDLAVRLERRPQLGVTDPGDDEVEVL